MAEYNLYKSAEKGQATRLWIKGRSLIGRHGKPQFTDAFFGYSPYPYLWLRLRYYFVNHLYFFLLHVAEFFVISQIFLGYKLGLYILIFHVTTLFVSGFWGLLEGQRIELNNSSIKSCKQKIVDDWYIFSWQIFVFSALVYLYLLFTSSLNISPMALVFLTLLGVRNLFDLVLRARYSAIFAYARVYRPMSSILFLETFGAINNFVFFYVFKSHTAVLSNIVVFSLLNTVINWHFVNKAYALHSFGLPKLSIGRLFRFSPPSGLLSAVAWNHFFYMLTQRSCSVLIVLVLHRSTEGALPIVFHLLSPLVTASTNWIQIFYFDFRKFRFSAFQRGLRNYYLPLMYVALGVGIIVSTFSIVSLKVLMTWQVTVIYLPLAIFLCARSVANTAFFVRFDQIIFGVSLVYLVLSLVIPATVIYLGSYSDPGALIILSLAQIISLLSIIFFKERYLRPRMQEKSYTTSPEQYERLREGSKNLNKEFMGRIDDKLVSLSRFIFLMSQEKDVEKFFIDRKTGVFFVLFSKEITRNDVVLLMQGDACHVKPTSIDDWFNFSHRLKARVVSQRNCDFECEIYANKSSLKNPGIKNSGILVRHINLGAIEPRNIYSAARKSMVLGSKVRVSSCKSKRIYVQSGTDSMGIVQSVKLSIERVHRLGGDGET
jgi:hypothetical protein